MKHRSRRVSRPLAFIVALLFFTAQFPGGVVRSEEPKLSEWVRKSLSAQAAGKHDEALSYADQAIQSNPNDEEAYNARGMALYGKDQTGLSKKAVESYDRAIQFKPDFFEAYGNRGNAYGALGMYDKDIADQTTALKISPNYSLAYNGRAWAFYMKNMYAEAIADTTRSLELNKKNADAYRNRGSAYYRTGKYELSIQDLDQAIALEPGNANFYRLRGRTYLKTGAYDKALVDCIKSIEINPNAAPAYSHKGDAHLARGEFDLAIKAYDRSIELDPKQAYLDSYFGRGKALKEKGKDQEAIENLKKAVEYDPGNEAYKKELAALGGETSVLEAIAQAPAELFSGGSGSGMNAAAASGAPATSSSGFSGEGARVLTPFSGYAVADICNQVSARPSGVPWREGGAETGTVTAAQTGQYESMLRHTRQGLRLFYGTMTPEEENSFDAFWAPFFDHPTPAALDYFQKINPLLDEMAETLKNLEGLLPEFGEALQGTLITGADPSSGAPYVARATYESVKVERTKLEDLAKRIAALGNPPNPLAAKCAARARHRKAVVPAAPAGDFDELLGMWQGVFKIDRSWMPVQDDKRDISQTKEEFYINQKRDPSMSEDEYYTLQERPEVFYFFKVTRPLTGNEEIEALKAKQAAQTLEDYGLFYDPKTQLVTYYIMVSTWRESGMQGAFVIRGVRKKNGVYESYNIFRTDPVILAAFEPKNLSGSCSITPNGNELDISMNYFKGTVSRTQGPLQGFTPEDLERKKSELSTVDAAETAALQAWNAATTQVERDRLHAQRTYLNQKSFLVKAWTLEIGEYLQNLEVSSFVYNVETPKYIEEWNNGRAGGKVMPKDYTYCFVGRLNELFFENGDSAQVSEMIKKTSAATPQKPVQTKAPVKVDPENDPKVIKEAIDQHMALAEQIRKDAARWAGDADKETNDDRKKELLKRAGEMRANAQAEQDVADSIRTGTLVHTRTEWDDQQHQALIGSIQKELAVFSAENKLIANIPKVGDMIAGAEGVQIREQIQQQISEAIKSPDAVQKLAAIYGGLQTKVINQGEQQMASEQAKVEMWDRRIAVAEGIQSAASTGIMLATIWSPTTLGSLALGYAGASGFAEDGVKGATVAVVRSVSSKADAVISAYEGATKIDPATGQPGGAWGAMEGALWSIGMNKGMEIIGGRIQKAKAQYALANQAAGGKGVKPVARATQEGRLKEYDFKTPEERYKTEFESAKTPEQKNAVNQKHAVQAEREAMHQEGESALKKAEDGVRSGADPAKAKEQYNKDLNAINEKYAAKETRNQEHKEVMEKLGFDPQKDIKPTGSDPKTAASDIDLTPQGATPHEAYQKGKKYTEAMKEKGHNIEEYGDRWVDTTTDATIWKPGFGNDKPGSSSFEAEVIFGTMPHSDKFGTKGGIEWTSSETHTTADPLGAVLANTGKAVGAGLGNSHPKDLHTVGKSAVKAAEAAGIDVDPPLKAQIDALKAHKTPEQAGVVDLGADQATKDKQIQTFLGKVQSLMGSAYREAKAKSDTNMKDLEAQAKAAGQSDEGYKIRTQVKAYQAGNDAALTTISKVSPGLVAHMDPAAKAADLVPELSGAGAGNLNLGGLAKELTSSRESASQAPPLAANSKDPAFAGLDKRCEEGAKRVAAKLAAAKPGSEDAQYLKELKTALEQGAKDPAQAVRSVRGVSGTELAVVLAQLGVPAVLDKKKGS